MRPAGSIWLAAHYCRDTAKDCRCRKKVKPREFPGVSQYNRVAVGVTESGLPPSSPSRRHRSLKYSCTQNPSSARVATVVAEVQDGTALSVAHRPEQGDRVEAD